MSEPLGLESKRVRIVPYDSRWKDLFEAEASRLVALVEAGGLPALELEHVGSTSVPDLAAKPILDIAAGRAHDVPASAYIAVLQHAGYVYRGDGGLPGRDFFRRGELRSHHLHLVERGGEHWRRYLVFRDALRSDAKLRAAYSALKTALADRFPTDREAYIEGKTEFVVGVLRERELRETGRG